MRSKEQCLTSNAGICWMEWGKQSKEYSNYNVEFGKQELFCTRNRKCRLCQTLGFWVDAKLEPLWKRQLQCILTTQLQIGWFSLETGMKGMRAHRIFKKHLSFLTRHFGWKILLTYMYMYLDAKDIIKTFTCGWPRGVLSKYPNPYLCNYTKQRIYCRCLYFLSVSTVENTELEHYEKYFSPK